MSTIYSSDGSTTATIHYFLHCPPQPELSSLSSVIVSYDDVLIMSDANWNVEVSWTVSANGTTWSDPFTSALPIASQKSRNNQSKKNSTVSISTWFPVYCCYCMWYRYFEPCAVEIYSFEFAGRHFIFVIFKAIIISSTITQSTGVTYAVCVVGWSLIID